MKIFQYRCTQSKYIVQILSGSCTHGKYIGDDLRYRCTQSRYIMKIYW